jgi:hypothetical protein
MNSIFRALVKGVVTPALTQEAAAEAGSHSNQPYDSFGGGQK